MTDDTPVSDSEMIELQAKLQKFKQRLKKNPSRTAVSIAIDEKNKPFIEVSYSQSAPEDAPSKDALPTKFENLVVKTTFRDFKTQNFAVEPQSPAQTTSRHPILRSGISVSHPSVTAGTLGALVVDLISGRISILSNWHVLVGSAGKGGDKIIQPGTADGGVIAADAVATLSRWILDKDGDAAIAALDGKRSWVPTTFITNLSLKNVRSVRLGELLEKVGRSTRVTRGRVTKFGSYTINYEVGARTVDGFEIGPLSSDNTQNEEISIGGDSGSCWYSASTLELIGLHFAGETDPDPLAEHAIACHAPKVFERLKIRIAGQSDLLESLVTQSQRSDRDNTTVYGKLRGSYAGNDGELDDAHQGSAECGAFCGTDFLSIVALLRAAGMSAWDIEAIGHKFGLGIGQVLLPDVAVRRSVPELSLVGWAAIGHAMGKVAKIDYSMKGQSHLSTHATAFVLGALLSAKGADRH